MSETQTNPEWVFDDECPKCGEDTELVAHVTEWDDGNPVRAELVCERNHYGGGDPCGHTWEWSADDE